MVVKLGRCRSRSQPLGDLEARQSKVQQRRPWRRKEAPVLTFQDRQRMCVRSLQTDLRKRIFNLQPSLLVKKPLRYHIPHCPPLHQRHLRCFTLRLLHLTRVPARHSWHAFLGICFSPLSADTLVPALQRQRTACVWRESLDLVHLAAACFKCALSPLSARVAATPSIPIFLRHPEYLWSFTADA